jgi:hypothetical protein
MSNGFAETEPQSKRVYLLGEARSRQGCGPVYRCCRVRV